MIDYLPQQWQPGNSSAIQHSIFCWYERWPDVYKIVMPHYSQNDINNFEYEKTVILKLSERGRPHGLMLEV